VDITAATGAAALIGTTKRFATAGATVSATGTTKHRLLADLSGAKISDAEQKQKRGANYSAPFSLLDWED
jgi:hypothetical protein